jgi:hypothetical protein
MINRGLTVALSFALLLGGDAVGQQPAQDPNQLPEQSAAPPAPAPAEKKAATDPFDYEASEQISEDLSVSFPVDI